MMRNSGVLVNCTSDTVIRFLPPLIISGQEIEEAGYSPLITAKMSSIEGLSETISEYFKKKQ
jgi:acetylornithine/succinyldiaminopimelate/putrescine aminotransferase